jgi:hypothetical protein
MTAKRTHRCRAIAIAAVLAASLFAAPGTAAPASAASTTPVLAVDAGDSVCVVRMDSTVGCWSLADLGEATPPAGTFTAVSTGGTHTCGIHADATLACWGQDAEVPPGGTFTAVSAGEDACAIRTGGTLACWSRQGGAVPTPPTGTFTAVSAGDDGKVCAIGSDRTLACWGGSVDDAPPPTGIFNAVSVGAEHVCAIGGDGKLTCWGSASAGATPPTGTFTAVSGRGYRTCGIRTDQTLACWGGFAGDDPPPGGTFKAVSAGSGACGIRTDGTLACWPDTYMPHPAVQLKAPMWPTMTSIALRWSGKAAVAPVTSYDIRYRRSSWHSEFSGSWVQWRSATTATSGTFTAAPGYTYCFSARAHDADGAVSDWEQSEACSAVPLDDRSFARVGNWTALSDSRLYRSTGLRSYSYGAKLIRTGVSSRSIRLVATTCPLCGKVKIYWNSGLLRTISLYSVRRVDRNSFRLASDEELHTGTLTIKVVSSGKKVIIDGVTISNVLFW